MYTFVVGRLLALVLLLVLVEGMESKPSLLLLVLLHVWPPLPPSS